MKPEKEEKKGGNQKRGKKKKGKKLPDALSAPRNRRFSTSGRKGERRGETEIKRNQKKPGHLPVGAGTKKKSRSSRRTKKRMHAEPAA